jgi:hypothetical protein
MTKDEAIRRILFALAELASQGPRDRQSADNAITMLEEVVEAIQNRKHQISQNPIHPGVPFNRADP